jgi:hypothetical protein
MMLSDPQDIRIGFDALHNGIFPPHFVDYLNSLQSGFAERLMQACQAVKGKANPTFSGQKSSWREQWSPAVEAYFNGTGLYDLNKALGYEE